MRDKTLVTLFRNGDVFSIKQVAKSIEWRKKIHQIELKCIFMQNKGKIAAVILIC